MAHDDPAVLLVGGGKMGGALVRGWVERGLAPARVVAVEPDAGARGRLPQGIGTIAGLADLPEAFAPDVVLLAVKPQAMEEVVPAYRRFAGRAVFLSIAAGKTIAWFAHRLGPEAAIVRAMPNTPAAVGRGMTVLCANAGTTSAQRERCGDLMAAVGQVAWIADEGQMDAVTAVSGSGPAYVFLLVECLARAGERAGLPPDLASLLARATVAGSGELLHRAPEAADELRRNVTSPGGTTAAALDALMAEDGLAPLLTRAIAAAVRRSRELAG